MEANGSHAPREAISPIQTSVGAYSDVARNFKVPRSPRAALARLPSLYLGIPLHQ